MHCRTTHWSTLSNKKNDVYIYTCWEYRHRILYDVKPVFPFTRSGAHCNRKCNARVVVSTIEFYLPPHQSFPRHSSAIRRCTFRLSVYVSPGTNGFWKASRARFVRLRVTRIISKIETPFSLSSFYNHVGVPLSFLKYYRAEWER